MLREKLIYLCGPIGGLSYEECSGWREYVMTALEKDVVEYQYTAQEGLGYKDGVPHVTCQTSIARPAGAIIVPKFKCICPMRGEEVFLKTLGTPIPTRHATISDHPLASDRVQSARDFWDVKEADVLFVNLLGAKEASIGSVGEVAIGWHLRKFILVIAEPGNIHTEHGLFREWASLVLPTIDDGITYLKEVLYR